MALDFVFFDLDGTLADNYDAITLCIAESVKPFGIKPFSRETVVRSVGGSILNTLKKLAGVEIAELAAPIYAENISRFEMRGLKSMPYSLEILESLFSRGIAAACLTNKAQDSAERICRRLGFSKYLRGVVGTQLRGPRKPEKRFIDSALKLFGANPKTSAIVGDSPYDYKTAVAGGLMPLLVATGGDSADSLKLSCPEAEIFRSLKEAETFILGGE
ncbi:MAG: HAD family hydrolase [Opitutales bacterium]|nr:HAD family hydrolase [Opitutales bacterium]